MRKISDKLILVDCDGVLVDWHYKFDRWMTEQGIPEVNPDALFAYGRYGMEKPELEKYIAMFNDSNYIEVLPPHKDAIHYIKKLHEEHGYVFTCLTSLGNKDHQKRLRIKNLLNLFGNTTFEEFIFFEMGACKKEGLKKYKDSGCYWVEDHTENVDIGLEYGLDSILMRHDYNHNYFGKAKIVDNWKEIYNYIVGE